MRISSLSPHLAVADGAAAIAFYEKAFGATLDSKMLAEDGRRLMHAQLKFGGQLLFLHDDFPECAIADAARPPSLLGGASLTLHLGVDDADAAWQQALDAGARIVVPLADQFWGMRYGELKDPFGHVWSIGGPLR